MRSKIGLGITAALLASSAAANAGSQLGVSINEINFAPSPAAADLALRFEYVEPYNSTASEIDITGWTVRDLDASNVDETLFTLPALSLPGRAFLVVYAAAATGVLVEDVDLSDGTGRLIATGWTGTAFLSNAGDAPQLYEILGITIQDFVYYDEADTGDSSVDDDAVAEGIWNDGAAIDTLSSGTTGRAIALRVDGAAPNEVDPPPNAEDLDWMQYALAVGGTPGRWNDPSTIFLDGFESADDLRWSLAVP